LIPKTATIVSDYSTFAAPFFGVIVVAMKIAEFLVRSHQRLVTCLPDDLLHAVAKRMYTHEIGAMPVCELGTRMVGIISERDLVRAFARTDWSEMQYIRARDVMATRIVSCGPEDTMRNAQELMRINHIRHLPVVKDGEVQAMLSMRDTLALRLRESEDEMNVLRDVVAASRHQNP
jgi:CBS domain-containing protein